MHLEQEIGRGNRSEADSLGCLMGEGTSVFVTLWWNLWPTVVMGAACQMGVFLL